jgi:4-hydroxybenzoate polyprenyltransferase
VPNPPDWPLLKLLRIQNVFTPVAVAFGGYGWTGTWDWRGAGTAAGASALLYTGGLVLNDLCDAQRDRTLHPARPIPSGKVSPAQALALGSALLVAGTLVAFSLGPRAGAVAAQIALFVVAYDSFMKRWRLPGAAAMGVLRGLNFALGMAAGGATFHDPATLSVPGALTAYTFVLTFLSTFEEGPKTRAVLGAAMVLAAGALLAPLPFVLMPLRAAAVLAPSAAAILAAGFRGMAREPEDFLPTFIRAGVVAMIPFSAAVLAGTLHDPLPAAATLALLLPTLALGRFLRGA